MLIVQLNDEDTVDRGLQRVCTKHPPNYIIMLNILAQPDGRILKLSGELAKCQPTVSHREA
jgi:hypothetical protein